MTTQPLPERATQTTVLIPFSHAANADGGAVITKIWAPRMPLVVDDVRYLNPTGLAENASNWCLIAVQKPLVVADHAIASVDFGAANALLFETVHGLETGDGPVRITTTGGAPAGLAVATDYYVIRNSDLSISFATTRDNALRGTAIDITSAGTGVHTLIDQAGTKRVLAWWSTDSDLPGANGIAANASLSLTLNRKQARVVESDELLEFLADESGTTTLPAGSGMIEARLIK